MSFKLFKGLPILVICMLFLAGCTNEKSSISHNKTEISIASTTEQELEISNPEKSQTLDDSYYDEHWPGKKKLVWIDDEKNIDTSIIITLNNLLVEQGYNFVIQYKQEDTYSNDYLEQMANRKENSEQIDLFNIGGNNNAICRIVHHDCNMFVRFVCI